MTSQNPATQPSDTSQGTETAERVLVRVKELEDYVTRVLQESGLAQDDGLITARVLVSADRRDIESHGVARLKRYVDGLATGIIVSNPKIETIKETPVSLVIDGGGGMGQVVTHRAMRRCIEKAKQNLICFATIRNSNHYGIAGYYTLMALAEKMIGISMTNSAPLVVPTHGRNALVGTNPISVGIPGHREKPFLLDMATSTVPRGKLEVYARGEAPVPDSWATDEQGLPTTDAPRVLDNLIHRRGGGLLPLGGGRELTGGHKGYCLSALVDIFCGVFSSGAVGSRVYGKKGAPAEVAHFLGVIDPAAFVGSDEMGQNLDAYIRMLRASEKATGQTEVLVAGEKEYRAEERNKETVSLQAKVFATLNELGAPLRLKLGRA